jgi:hypothetical protein
MVTDADLAEIARRTVASLDWNAILHGNPDGIVRQAVYAIDWRGLEHVRHVVDTDTTRLWEFVLAAFTMAWKAQVAVVEDGDVESLIAVATANMNWPALAAIWATGGDDTDEMMQGLLSIDTTPEYARLSKHHSPEPLVQRIVNGLLANVAERRVA